MNDLDQINLEYQALEALGHLHDARFVPGSGPVDAYISIVGEAPGASEDEAGVPFVGAAGQLLDRMLADQGIDKRSCYITNVIKYRPPHNRTPYVIEAEAAYPLIRRELEAVGSDFVLLLGACAYQMLRPGGRISKDHGRALVMERVVYLPLYHPAAALREPEIEAATRNDLHRFMRT